MKVWETPSFEELAMNAEIGAYQPDFDDGGRGSEPTSAPTARDVKQVPTASAGHVD